MPEDSSEDQTSSVWNCKAQLSAHLLAGPPRPGLSVGRLGGESAASHASAGVCMNQTADSPHWCAGFLFAVHGICSCYIHRDEHELMLLRDKLRPFRLL